MRRRLLRSIVSQLEHLPNNTGNGVLLQHATRALVDHTSEILQRNAASPTAQLWRPYTRSTDTSTILSFASIANPALETATETNTDIVTSTSDAQHPLASTTVVNIPALRASTRIEQRQAIDKKLQHEMKAEAVYIGSRIHVRLLMNRPEFRYNYKRLHKGSVTIALSDRHIPDQCESDGMPLEPYMVAYDYGAAVFMNTSRDIKEMCMTVLRDVASDPVPMEKPITEEYSITVAPRLETWSLLDSSTESIQLKALDLKNIQVISQVLAQSVALDYYSSHVERAMKIFRSMNLEMADTANLTKINKQHLLQLVAENNIVMTEIIAKLGVHERYDIAWKHVQYGRIWDFLRSELEMDARFKILDMKLNLIQDNLKYFLEILQARKSDALEWTIIILIGVEIGLSLYELALKMG